MSICAIKSHSDSNFARSFAKMKVEYCTEKELKGYSVLRISEFKKKQTATEARTCPLIIIKHIHKSSFQELNLGFSTIE